MRLLKPSELDADWNPSEDTRRTVWEMTHHLVRRLEAGGRSRRPSSWRSWGAGEDGARPRVPALCDQRTQEMRLGRTSYNGLVQSWPEIVRLTRQGGGDAPAQGALDLEDV